MVARWILDLHRVRSTAVTPSCLKVRTPRRSPACRSLRPFSRGVKDDVVDQTGGADEGCHGYSHSAVNIAYLGEIVSVNHFDVLLPHQRLFGQLLPDPLPHAVGISLALLQQGLGRGEPPVQGRRRPPLL